MPDQTAPRHLSHGATLAWLDQALALGPGQAGIRREYPAGVPLTVSRAEALRRAISSNRYRYRQRGNTAYDGISIQAIPDLSSITMRIRWARGPEAPVEPTRAQLQQEAFTPSLLPEHKTSVSACWLTLTHADGRTWYIDPDGPPAASFLDVWKSFRPTLPGMLVFSNQYACAEVGALEVVGGAEPSTPSDSDDLTIL